MAKARKIRKRAKAVGNVRTITRTVEMIASARYQKACDLAASARPHTDKLAELVGDLLDRGTLKGLDHPLLREPEGCSRHVLLVLTSTRGLCGAYNWQVLDLALDRRRQLIDAGYEVLLWVSGKRGLGYMGSHGLQVGRSFTEFGYKPGYEQASGLAEELMAMLTRRQISGVEVAYMQYFSRGRQQPAIAQILPMELIEPPQRLPVGGGEPAPYETLPSAEDVLRNLLPATCRMRLWQCFIDAGVSEQAMRMASMQAATGNAEEMIHDLTVQYNRRRQAQITAELSEIMGGREALA